MKIDLEINNTSRFKMSYTNDPIYQGMSVEMGYEFMEHYNTYWNDYDEEWDDFKEEAVEEIYNNTNQEVEQDYKKLIFYLRVIKEDYDEYGYGYGFKDYNDPQKIVNLAYYFVAKRVFEEFQEEAFDYGDEEDEPITNEEADQELFRIFGE